MKLSRKLLGTAIGVLILAGCASTDVAQSWVGANVDSLIMAWGAPERDYELPDGGRELTYSHQRFHSGTSMYCNAKIRTGPNGVITWWNVNGNIGGCNRLLWSKPARAMRDAEKRITSLDYNAVRKSAEQGDALSQTALALMYEDGEGIPQDYVKAHMWYNVAASLKRAINAREYLVEKRDHLAKNMTRTQVAEAQRLAREWMAKFEKKK